MKSPVCQQKTYFIAHKTGDLSMRKMQISSNHHLQSHHLHTQQLQICHLPIWTNATGRDGVNLVTVVEALNSHAPVYKWRGQSCLHKQLIQSRLLVWWFCGQFALWTCIANAQALRNALIVFKRMPTCNVVQSDCHAWRLGKCMGPMHRSCKGIDILSRMCKERSRDKECPLCLSSVRNVHLPHHDLNIFCK